MPRFALRARVRRSAALVAVAALTFTGFAIQPAQASVSQGGVYGSGTVTDDWGDEGTLSTNQNSHNSVVLLWQSVLYADGYLAVGDVDCYFGATTKAATRKWQDDRGLDDDGIVGPNTFSRADNKLSISGSTITYDGSVRNLSPFYRTGGGRWYTVSSNGTAYYFDYTNATICSIL